MSAYLALKDDILFSGSIVHPSSGPSSRDTVVLSY